MKNFIGLSLIFTLFFVTSCSDDSAVEEPAKYINFILSNYDIELDRGESATVEITADMQGLEVTGADFSLLSASGSEPEFVSISSYQNISDKVFRLSLRDKRDAASAMKYSEEVFVVHTPTGVKDSRPLLLHSAAYIPVVRLTTEVSQSSINKNTWVKGSIEIDGGGEFPDLEKTVTEVKGRGNSTWGWEKKPYALKLDSKQEVLGMPSHKRWCLIANYMDRTQLRNRVAYHIGDNTNLAYTPRNKYVELYFNGTYQGLYLLTEQIKENKNRVNITEMGANDNSGDAVTGGYLLEYDTNYDEDKRFYSSYTRIPVNLKYPDAADITSQQWTYIQSYINDVDKAVYNLNYGTGTSTAIFNLLDRQSMIDFWIVFEVMANHEVLHPKSIYFHKDRGGKLIAGPVWDFDYETLVQHTATQWINYNLSWAYNEFPWYDMNWWNILLKKDSSFRADVKKRWNELYPFLSTIPDYMDKERDYIAKAVVRNNQRWPSINGTGNPNRDETLSFDAAVERLKSIYTQRIQWMNTQISMW